MTRCTPAALALLLAATAAPLAAQSPLRTALEWRTLSTARYDFHYPAPFERWTRALAERAESQGDAVSAIVGWRPRGRVQVVVEDPANQSNGSAVPSPGQSVIFLLPTPPDARSDIGSSRGFPEKLFVHELAHVAHLERATRNARWARLSRLSPVPFSPIAWRTPRWATEGYATYVEGRLTGTGRPHSALRAALVRAWALEGRLPRYAEVSRAAGGYRAGSMAYHVGSAYWDWLALRSGTGDTGMVHVWRRLTARQDRRFDAAFAGVYRGTPAELYGRFTAEATASAMEIERRIAAEGEGRGTLVQRRAWHTGDPAVSPDGERIVVQLPSQSLPSRVVVWSTREDTLTTAERTRRARAQALDPDDVPSIEYQPRPRRALATLRARRGRGFAEPRWFPDGRRVLVSSARPRADGSERADLFVWDTRGGAVRQVTRGAGLRAADPSPDGRSAAAVRCDAGICDVVHVDLASGAVTVLAAGSPAFVFSRPRWSPDGTRILVSTTDRGPWRIGTIPAAGGEFQPVPGLDPASRYDASWLPDGRRVVCTSERGGIPNLEVVDVETGQARTVTGVLGAAWAAAPVGDSAAFFLDLHAGGLDLRLARLDRQVMGPPLAATDPKLAPAARRMPVAAPSFVATTPGPSRAYGAGPRAMTAFAGGIAGAEGWLATAWVAGTDPVGRLTWLAQGGLGARSSWRGGALSAAWRGFPVELRGDVFHLAQRPSLGSAGPAAAAPDAAYAGAALSAGWDRPFALSSVAARLLASAGRVDPTGAASGATRALAAGVAAAAIGFARERRGLTLRGELRGAGGTTAGDGWARGQVSAGVAARGLLPITLPLLGNAVAVTGSYAATGRGAPAYERLSLGGVGVPFVDGLLMTQRLAMPALPAGVAGGSRAATWRASAPLLGGEAYLWHGAAGERLDRWRRVIGLERALAGNDFTFIGLPNARLLAGAGWSIDAPRRRHLAGYASVTFSP